MTPRRPASRSPLRRLAVAAATVALASGGCITQSGGINPCQYVPTDTSGKAFKDYTSGFSADEPCKEQMYFPNSVALDPDRDFLYVASFNADLRFSGAALQAIDVARFEYALAYFRDREGFDKLQANPGFPTVFRGMDFAPDVVTCRGDLLDPSIVECDETPFVASAVKIGNFAGAIKIQKRTPEDQHPFTAAEAACPLPATVTDMVTGPDGSLRANCTGPQPFQRRLWLGVRGDPSITFVNVDKPTAKDPGDPRIRLDCQDPKNNRPLASCNGQRITVHDYHWPGQLGGGCNTDTDCPNPQTCDTSTQKPAFAPTARFAGTCTPVPLPTEPFGLALDEKLGYLVVSHLAGGEVSLINADAWSPTSTPEQPARESVVLDVRSGFFNGDAQGRRGAYSVAPLSVGDPNSYWFVTSRLNPLIGLFRIGDIGGTQAILPSVGFALAGGAFSTGDDVRDVVIEPGTRAYFVENHPPTLFTVDIRPILRGGEATTTPSNTVVDIVDVCQGPSHLAMRKWYQAAAPGEPPSVATRLFVVCTASGQLWQVDPDQARVVAQTSTGRGPNSIDFNFDLSSLPPNPPASCFDGVQGGGETQVDCGTRACGACPGDPCAADPDCESGACALGACQPRRAYIANFTDSTVAVMDLEPRSPKRDRVIARIGLTSPPFNQ